MSINRCLRILAADSDPAMQQLYQEALAELGHHGLVVASGRRLIEQCRGWSPELVVTDLDLPEGDALTVAAEVCREQVLPFLLVCGRPLPPVVEQSPSLPIYGCLCRPVSRKALGPAIVLAMRCFERIQAAQQEAARLRQALEDRKLLERAKGLIMRFVGLDEEAAHRRLRRAASDRNGKLIEVAQEVIRAGEVFRQLEKGF